MNYLVPEKKYRSLVAPCLAEVLGTATLMFIGCMGCIVDIYNTKVIQFAPLTFGLAVGMAVQVRILLF